MKRVPSKMQQSDSLAWVVSLPHHAAHPEVPAISVQRVAYSAAAVPEPSQANASRHAWRAFRRLKYGWSIPTRSLPFPTGNNDEILDVPYFSPLDIFKYLVTHHPSLVVGGVADPRERSQHLEGFWRAYKQIHSDHTVFSEHPHSLCRCIPICYHGDEGRGKRRGNTVVLSVEAVLGIMTGWKSSAGKETCTDCCPPSDVMEMFPQRSENPCAGWDDYIKAQQTNMKGHSFLQHYPTFVLPGTMYKKHGGLMQACLGQMSNDLKQGFFDGFQDGDGRIYFLVVVGSKGDLKWMARAACLKRSFEHVGRKRHIEMCHECAAGSEALPFEDVTSEIPGWTRTIHTTRPWDELQPPAIASIPYSLSAPESQLKRDVFHLCKVGIYRDFCASAILWLLSVGYFGSIGDVDAKLERAHNVFSLFCQTTNRTPALRSFNKRFFNYTNLSAYGWTNSKGSDTMHLVAWVQVLCVACKNDLLHEDHLEILNLMHSTAKSASAFFKRMNTHGLFMAYPCAVSLWMEVRSFIRGYGFLAHKCFSQLHFPGFSMKPKIHLLRHSEHEVFQWLSDPSSHWIINPISFSCEQNEDFIGRSCRLSRRCDTRTLCVRVLQSIVLKGDMLHRRWLKFGPGPAKKPNAKKRLGTRLKPRGHTRGSSS